MQSDEIGSGRTDPWEGRMAGHRPARIPPLPAAIVAVGSDAPPPEPLLTLQSAIARFVHLATSAGRLRPKLRFRALPSLRFR